MATKLNDQDMEIVNLSVVIAGWLKNLVSARAIKVNFFVQGIYWLLAAMFWAFWAIIAGFFIDNGTILWPLIFGYCLVGVGIAAILPYAIGLFVSGAKGGKKLKFFLILLFFIAPMVPSSFTFLFRAYYAMVILQNGLKIKLEAMSTEKDDYRKTVHLNPNYILPESANKKPETTGKDKINESGDITEP